METTAAAVLEPNLRYILHKSTIHILHKLLSNTEVAQLLQQLWLTNWLIDKYGKMTN